MKFTAQERMAMSQLLPALVPEKSNRHFYAMVTELSFDMSFTDKENEHLAVKMGGQEYIDPLTDKKAVVPQGQIVWKPENGADKDINIPKAIREIIVQKFKEWDKADELPADAVFVFDRFVKKGEWHKKE